ncbi:MAG: hypothetical protein J6Q76_00620 [Clostridia bacterium]|nr:hypothetical protein [Clostridia bacterium]
MNKRFVVYTLGRILVIESALMLLPFLVGLIYGEKALGGSLLPPYRPPLRALVYAIRSENATKHSSRERASP